MSSKIMFRLQDYIISSKLTVKKSSGLDTFLSLVLGSSNCEKQKKKVVVV